MKIDMIPIENTSNEVSFTPLRGLHAIILNDSGDEIVRRTMGGYKIADMMRNQGWTVEVLDWTTRWTNAELKQFIDSLPCELNMVGISNLWMKDDVVIEQIKFLKKEYPNIKIVMAIVNMLYNLFLIGYLVTVLYRAANFLNGRLILS